MLIIHVFWLEMAICTRHNSEELSLFSNKNNVFALPRFPLLLFFPATLLCLAACADAELPKWFSAEPHKSDLASYNGPIAMPPVDAAGAAFPNLADVPPNPAISARSETDKVIAELQQDNATGQAVVADYVQRHEGAAPVPAKINTSKKKKKPKAKRKGTP